MTDRIVVCFRSADLLASPEAYLSGARALSERAAALGGRLVSWGATVYAFEFEPDALEDAIELSLSVLRDAPSGREHGIGISEGPLSHVEEATQRMVVTWGPALVAATAFARAARTGEVLVDPTLPAVKRGELLTVGSRMAIHGKLRLRGLVLDARHPWRTALAEGAPALVRPELVGRPELAELFVPAGNLGVLRAGRGFGGTRFLEELEQGLEPARVLRITPHPFGEPLGALRRALLRAVTLGQAPLRLTDSAGHSLDALLAGEGLDAEGSAELVALWLLPDAPRDPSGVVLLDDANEIDADTLEVIDRAVAISVEPFRVIARIGDLESVPSALGAIPVSTSVRLGPLSPDEAIRLAVLCTRGELDEKGAARWATRGGRLPLGIAESIREAADSGEIVWEEGRAIARLRSSGTGGPRPPKHWIRRRLDHLERDGRRVLEAIATLGGQVEARELVSVIRRRADLRVDTEAALAVLEAAGWTERHKPDLFQLPSATHRDAILASMADTEFAAWHAAACDVFAERDRPLASAPATIHAVLAGDMERALALGRRAAAATRAIGLSVTADAYERFVEQRDLEALAARNLFTSQLELSRAVPSVWPDGGARASERPPSVRDPERPPRREAISAAPRSALARSPVSSVRAGQASEAPRAVEALKRGDLETVERMARELAVDESRSGLAERLKAMANLARGETGDAIRRLRDAAGEAKRTGSRDRCRASLALAVALAAASRHDEALLEGLDALARARETEDAKGERACARFLSQLSATAGHSDAAAAWAALASG
jgi:hypothetical protein